LATINSQKHFFKKKGLAIAIWVYWFLLFYIIAALVYWYIALQQQNNQMTTYKIRELNKEDPAYTLNLAHIYTGAHNKTIQYNSEGSTFLILILISAIFVYRAVRRQFRLQQQQQNFMMAVTHELKTPIAVAKLNLETLKRFKLDEEKRQKMIASALEETERLNTLANNILVSSQLEGGGYTLSREEIDLSALTRQLAVDFQSRYPERKWELLIEPDLEVIADPLLLQMLVNNLVENAIKYSPKDSPLSIGLKKDNKHILLYIKDQGPGIKEAEKKKIFEKFYRVGNEATRTAQGTGLGLYLCRKIAEDHHALLSVADNQPKGSIFTVRLNKIQ
jgi:two-component system, OmpR family, sensor histidine kinase CiaH